MPEKILIRVRRLGDAWDGLLGDHQHMHGCLWVDILEGKDAVILVHNVRGNLARDDFFEQRHHTIMSVSFASCWCCATMWRR